MRYTWFRVGVCIHVIMIMMYLYVVDYAPVKIHEYRCTYTITVAVLPVTVPYFSIVVFACFFFFVVMSGE